MLSRAQSEINLGERHGIREYTELNRSQCDFYLRAFTSILRSQNDQEAYTYEAHDSVEYAGMEEIASFIRQYFVMIVPRGLPFYSAALSEKLGVEEIDEGFVYEGTRSVGHELTDRDRAFIEDELPLYLADDIAFYKLLEKEAQGLLSIEATDVPDSV